ncbi:MAG: hypothetical protein U9P12_06160 [Verrucomicrobiota bacterium]|nr:hypothetical protein [Verrucomicrobiota bacterium]
MRRALDWIHAAERNEYSCKKNADFIRVFHDYTKANGFKQWREGFNQFLFKGAELNEKTEDQKETDPGGRAEAEPAAGDQLEHNR